MSRSKYHVPRVFLIAAMSLGVVGLGGCNSGGGGGKKGGRVRTSKPPTPPLPAPPRQQVAIDPALMDAARKEIYAGFESTVPRIRAHAIEAMKEGIGAQAGDSIVKGLSDSSGSVRFAASLAAGELRLAQARPALLVLSDDVNANARIGAKFALHRLGDTRQTRDLEATARDPEPGVRGHTALVLGLLGEPTATRVLEPMMADPSPAVRLQVAESLWRLEDEKGLENLVAASVGRYADDQVLAILALAGPRDSRVMRHLYGALTSDYDEASLAAARGLGLLGSDRGMGVALKFVQSRDPRQRSMAALALGAIGRTDAQDELSRLLKDPDQDVRLAAATALLQLK